MRNGRRSNEERKNETEKLSPPPQGQVGETGYRGVRQWDEGDEAHSCKGHDLV